MARKLRALGPFSLALLAYIRANPWCETAELAHAMGCSYSRVAAQLTTLYTRKLIARQYALFGRHTPQWTARPESDALEVAEPEELVARHVSLPVLRLPKARVTRLPKSERKDAEQCCVPFCGAYRAPGSERCAFHRNLVLG